MFLKQGQLLMVYFLLRNSQLHYFKGDKLDLYTWGHLWPQARFSTLNFNLKKNVNEHQCAPQATEWWAQEAAEIGPFDFSVFLVSQTKECGYEERSPGNCVVR